MPLLLRLKALVRPVIAAVWTQPRVAGKADDILDWYVKTAPHPQRALDIFKGEWASTLPAPYSDLQTGPLPLFGDPRLIWAAGRLGRFEGKTVLELGPLEGGHSWMMSNLGAASVTGVEANTRAFLKCLILKELLGMPRTRFLCGDFVSYLEEEQPRYDIVFASGVLYHMRDPVHLIDLIGRAADRVYLWTHYYDPRVCGAVGSRRFSTATESEYQGFKYHPVPTRVPCTCFGMTAFSAAARRSATGSRAPTSSARFATSASSILKRRSRSPTIRPDQRSRLWAPNRRYRSDQELTAREQVKYLRDPLVHMRVGTRNQDPHLENVGIAASASAAAASIRS